MNKRVISLCYHDVREKSEAVITQEPRTARDLYALGRARFREHLAAIQSSPAGQRVATTRALGQADNSCVLFAFDDGAQCALQYIADDLEHHGWRGHFFVTTSWISQPGFLDPSGIRELDRRGHVIGSHTVTHPSRMSALSRRQLMAEWSDSCAALSDILGSPVDVASVSDGYYSRLVGETAAEAGIRFLFNSEPVTKVNEVDRCLVLGRFSIQQSTTAAEAAALANSRWLPRALQFAGWNSRKILKQIGGEHYLLVRSRLLQTLRSRQVSKT